MERLRHRCMDHHGQTKSENGYEKEKKKNPTLLLEERYDNLRDGDKCTFLME